MENDHGKAGECVRVGWKPAEGVAQRDAGEYADVARAIVNEARNRRDRAIAVFQLFVTPEYNRSVPAALKNALDVGSRPYGSSVWDRKPGAIVSCSPSAIGAFGANHHLRQSLVFLNVPTMQQPEAYVGHADKLFDEQGKLVNDGTRKFLQEFMQAFANWVETVRSQGGVSERERAWHPGNAAALPMHKQ